MKSDDGKKAVANQKVFITIAGYYALVTEYKRLSVLVNNQPKDAAGQTNASVALKARLNALEFVFRETGLPLD
jgi:hypothetical protein